MKRLHRLIGLAAACLVPLASVDATVLLYDFENLPIGTETPFAIDASGVHAGFTGS